MNNKFSDLKSRILFLLGALLVFRLGVHIPVPGIDAAMLAKFFKGGSVGLLGMVNMFSGGAFSKFSVFALGIMPYISSSIIMQLSSEIFPSLIALKKESESGKKKIAQYSRYLTVLLATIQATGVSMWLYRQPHLVLEPSFTHFFVSTLFCLVAGSVFLMWLGEQITDRGIGNGSSMIITAGIVTGIPPAMFKTLSLTAQGSMPMLVVVFVAIFIVAVTFLVVFIERAQRKIPISYAQRQVGNKVMQAQTTYLPLKINMAGVIPAIFASSIIIFPNTVISWLSHGKLSFLSVVNDKLKPGQPIYMCLYAAAIIFFSFFYTALVFNPKETAANLKRGGAFIPGIRPGEFTANYIEKVVLRLTLIGALYIVFICLFPEFLILKWNVPFYFGGTALLIVVVVVIDFMNQVQSHIASVQYDSLLRKANLKKGIKG